MTIEERRAQYEALRTYILQKETDIQNAYIYMYVTYFALLTIAAAAAAADVAETTWIRLAFAFTFFDLLAFQALISHNKTALRNARQHLQRLNLPSYIHVQVPDHIILQGSPIILAIVSYLCFWGSGTSSAAEVFLFIPVTLLFLCSLFISFTMIYPHLGKGFPSLVTALVFLFLGFIYVDKSSFLKSICFIPEPIISIFNEIVKNYSPVLSTIAAIFLVIAVIFLVIALIIRVIESRQRNDEEKILITLELPPGSVITVRENLNR